MSLTELNKRYEELLKENVSESIRSKKLADLMTEMEGIYKIPMLRNEAWERDNRKVIALYRKISRSRDI
ncbi:hypothetical protein [Alkalihalobacterium sp. APHAB7]|uniref:hypothetical protein n=1 Tax=Alkalihalobacterium sp. APHAB7 TaxID=3402081 RepID=UPI003AAB5776